MSLKNLARTQVSKEHGISFAMLPYTPALSMVYKEVMAREIGNRDWTTYENIYLLTTTTTVDLVLSEEGEVSDAARQIVAYFDNRTSDPMTDFQSWLLLSADAINLWFDVYESTRQRLPQASKVLQDGRPMADDPLVSKKGENGNKPLKVKSPA